MTTVRVRRPRPVTAGGSEQLTFQGVGTRAERIAALERELEVLRQDDRNQADRALVTAIATAVGGAVFSVADLLARRAIDPDLRDALGTLNGRQVGKRLARLAGRELVDGVRLVRVREVHTGWMWVMEIQQPS